MSGARLGSATYELILDDAKLLRGIDAAQGKVDRAVGGIEQSFAGIDKAANNTSKSFATLGTGAATGAADASRSMTSLAAASDLVGTRTTQSFAGARVAASSFADSLSPIPLGFAGVGVAAAGATAAVGAFAASSVAEFASFQSDMNQVFSLMPQASEAATSAMSDDVRDFSDDMGILTSETVPALYEALSAGVPADNVFEFLETAQQAAVGGATDLQTAVTGISSVVNAYGEEVISAAEASDAMFTAVVAGTTTFEELSRNLADVTPLSAALGVSFGDISAALATMTVQGTRTTVATTQLRALLVELSDSSTIAAQAFEDISGSSFQEFIAQGNNVADALVIMQQAADEAGVPIQEMFGSVEAGIGALSLSGSNLDAFNQNIVAVGQSAGSTQAAYEQMDQGAGRAIERLQVAWHNLKLEVGEGLAPLVEDLATKLEELPDRVPIEIVFEFVTQGEGTAGVLGEIFFGGLEVASFAPQREMIENYIAAASEGARVDEEAAEAAHAHADARQRFIDEHAYDPEYSGIDGHNRLLQDANRHAAEAIATNYQLAESARYVNREREFSEAIANDLGLAQGQLTEYTRDYIAAAVIAANTDGELITHQNRLAVASAATNVARREGLDTTRVTTQAEGELEVALARVHAAYLALSAVQRQNVTIQGQIGGVVDAFANQGAQYTSELNAMEDAHAALIERQRLGLDLSDDQLLFLENYGSAHERVEGAVADAAIQEGLAAAAKVEVWRAQEDLNEAIANGETNLEPYNERLKTAQDYLSDVDPASGATQAIETLGTSIDKLVPLFQGLLDAMTDLDEQEVDPEVTMKKDLFEKGATEVEGDIIHLGSQIAEPTADLNSDPFASSLSDANVGLTEFDGAEAVSLADLDDEPFNRKMGAAEQRLATWDNLSGSSEIDGDDSGFNAALGAANSGLTEFDGSVGTAYLNLNADAFYSALEGAAAMLPHSPAKEGPLAFIPDWSYLTDGMGSDTRQGAERATDMMASYFPMARPRTGALRQPLDWNFLFDGLDESAETYAADAAQRIVDFITDLDQTALASGDLLADANAKLASLFNAKQIAEEMRLGEAIIAGIQEQIDAQQDRVNAIGAAMGTDVVQGIAAALASGQLAEELAAFRLGVFEGFSFDDLFAQRANLQATINEMTLLRDAALELDDTATADALTADIALLNGELELTNQIIGTDAVAAWNASQQAAEQAAAAAARYVEAFTSISDPGTLGNLQQELRDAQLALDVAIKSGAEPAVIAELRARLAEVVLAYNTFVDGLDVALQHGLLTQDEMIALASQGGDALAAVIASGQLMATSALAIAEESLEGFRAVLEAGLLPPELVEQLIANADEAQREILVELFGEEFVAGVGTNLARIDAATFEQLKSMVAQGFLTGQDLVTAIAEGMASGRLSVEQAMELIGSDLESISTTNAIALLDTYEQLGQDLADAYASGNADAIAAAQAAWDAFLLYLAEIAEASGMTVDEIIAHFGELKAASLETAEVLSGTNFAVGGSVKETQGAYAELTDQIREYDQAARDASAKPILAELNAGNITLEEATRLLDEVENGFRDVADTAERESRRTVSSIRSVQDAFEQLALELSLRKDGFALPFEEALARLREAAEINAAGAEDALIASIESTAEALQRFIIEGNEFQEALARDRLRELVALADAMGYDIGEALGDAFLAGLRDELEMHSPSRKMIELATLAAESWQSGWERMMDQWTSFALPMLPDSLVSPAALSGMVTLASSQAAQAPVIIESQHHYHVENPSLAALRNQQELVNRSLGKTLESALRRL